ncbi:hypothetical protein [Clostridium cylindrosporum]|uniref:Uncharacterized protein n=1 Tax=Clostridium cylindrosporum DSM 605 TaxID=1121307 RepID=A0A0J8DBK5_CLOCY|nr:hypothetical protein [Clostridium cylindrosporum]KMT21694.1 hypothetical protein CLCY_2c04560 [Clostridium cylindrosporum DSM 605]
MAIHPFTLDYSDANVIKNLQVETIQTVKKSTMTKETNNKKNPKKRSFHSEKQDEFAKELTLVFDKMDLVFEYIIGNHKINIKVYDKYKELILEDSLEDLEDLLISIKNEKGKIIDLKV